jgi:hypothetical protein
MADYRQIHTRIWKDSWFLSLTPEEKLLFIYLFGNERASVAGIYELPMAVIAFETGLDETGIKISLEAFSTAGKVFYENDVVWVVNLRKYNDSGSSKVKIKIEKDFAAVPDGSVKTLYAQHYQLGYPIRRKKQAQIPYPAAEREQEQEQEKEQEQKQKPNTPQPPEGERELVEAVFDAWERYFPGKPQPRRTEEQQEKVKKRLRSDHFREHYEAALAAAAQSRTLQNASWFSFEFLVKNESNYQKMLDGWMAWKDKQFNGQAHKPALAQVTIDEADRLNTLLARGEL